MATRDSDGGRRVNSTPKANASPSTTIGEGGTIILGGFIANNEKDSTLAGQARYTTYSNFLANTTIVAAGVRFFVNMVAKAAWLVEPADETEEAKKKADLIKEMMLDMDTPWHSVIRRAAMYRFYGFSIQEWTAKKRDDGVIGMLDVEARPQFTIEQWDVDRSGTVHGMVQRSPQTGEQNYLPRKKVVYVVDNTLSDSPEGLGLFRHLVDSARRLKRLEQLEGFGYETDMRGIPVGRAPLTKLSEMVEQGTITAKQRDDLLQPMLDFLSGHIKNSQNSMLLDSQTWETQDEKQAPSATRQFDMELMRGDSYAFEELATAIQRLNMEIARLLNVEHLLLGFDGRGSLALARDKSNSFGLVVDSALQEIASTLDRDFVTPIFELNGWDLKLRPKMKTERLTHRDVTEISTVLKDLAASGVMLSREDDAVSEFFDILGFSKLLPLKVVDPDMALSLAPPPPAEGDGKPGSSDPKKDDKPKPKKEDK